MFEQKEMHSGDVSSRLEKDIDVVSDATTSLFPDMTVTLIQLVGAFLLMQSMDARLAWVLLLLTPMFLIVGKLIGRKMRMMTLDIRKQESVIQMLVQETMEHNAVLRSLESGDWITNRLDDMQQDLLFTIEDTGPGIPPDKADFIFEKFTKIDMFTEGVFVTPSRMC